MSAIEIPHTQPLADVLDIFDELEPGDRVLWGDRSQPCTVARVVDEDDDRAGQCLTASVITRDPSELHGNDSDEEYFLQAGDVFLDPRTWGGLRGTDFVVIHGPRGGFYAIARAERRGRTTPALFRAVRSYHSTRKGQPGQGAWDFQGWLTEGEFSITSRGEPPEELDPVGDLPAYEDIRENRVVSYDDDESEHYVVTDTVEEAFDEGLYTAHERAAAELKHDLPDEAEEGDWADVPDADRVEGRARQSHDNPDGEHFGTVTITEIYRSEYGLKAVLDAPAPWEVPDHATPFNEAIKTTPWEATHRTFDPDREAWTADADELGNIAATLRGFGYDIVDER